MGSSSRPPGSADRLPVHLAVQTPHNWAAASAGPGYMACESWSRPSGNQLVPSQGAPVSHAHGTPPSLHLAALFSTQRAVISGTQRELRELGAPPLLRDFLSFLNVNRNVFYSVTVILRCMKHFLIIQKKILIHATKPSSDSSSNQYYFSQDTDHLHIIIHEFDQKLSFH